VRVLVTNDDGVEAPGIRALATALAGAGHDVVVVAPSGERSGSGAGIGRLHRAGPIAWTEVSWHDLPNSAVHAVDVPPAGAVYAGCLGAFGPRPDVVASGINSGLNHSHLVLHSGTVGAALTAAAIDIPAVAVSLAWGEGVDHYETAAALGVTATEWVARQPHGCALNLNVPNVPMSELRGVREARLGSFNERWTATTSPGELVLEYDGHDGDPEPDTDLALVRQNFATVTLLEGITACEPSGAAPFIEHGIAASPT
jgi:5'-nucleotidase